MTSTRKMRVLPAITLSPELTVLQAVKEMVKKKEDAVLIIEGGKLSGIFTERDLIERVALKAKRLSKTKLRDVMTPQVHTVPETINTEEAIRTMYMKKCHHLPVVRNDGSLIGMLSFKRILERRIYELNIQQKDLLNFLLTDGIGGD